MAPPMGVQRVLLVGTLARYGIAKASRASSSRVRLLHEFRAVQRDGIALTTSNELPANETAIRLAPLPKNLLEWHFTFTGVPGSEYEGGIYHGRFICPKDYPRRAPRVQMLTPSGRFLTFTDICLSASSYHQETWSTHWSLSKLVTALRLHMLTQANEIGGENFLSFVRHATRIIRSRCFWLDF